MRISRSACSSAVGSGSNFGAASVSGSVDGDGSVVPLHPPDDQDQRDDGEERPLSHIKRYNDACLVPRLFEESSAITI